MIDGGSVGKHCLTIADVPVVLVLAALGRTSRTPADPGRRRPADAATMGWRWDSAAPSPRPPRPLQRRWELSTAESNAPPARPASRCVRVGGRVVRPGDPRSEFRYRPGSAPCAYSIPQRQPEHPHVSPSARQQTVLASSTRNWVESQETDFRSSSEESDLILTWARFLGIPD